MRTFALSLMSQRSHAPFAATVALLLGTSLASAQTAPAAPAAGPAAPAAPGAAPASEPSPTATPTEPGAATAAGAVDATELAAAPAATADPNAVPAQASAGVDAGATTTSATDTSDEALASDESAAQITEELSGGTGKLNVYGFTDFTYNHVFSNRSGWNVPPAWYPSFYVGNLNLYLGSDLGKGWRTLSEVRFTYLPDGTQATTFNPDGSTTTTRNNAVYEDYADYNHKVRVGGVIIERAYLEYQAHPLLTIRGGQFLTPYGIWNVEHGTTVIVGTTRPYVIGADLFPVRQTGLEFYGSYGFSSTQVGYHLTLSNGRGGVDTYRDLDKNKALGWRLWVQQDTDVGTFTLGTSGYKGRYSDRLQTTVMDFATPGAIDWRFDYPIQSEYKELALAADVKWSWKGALVQGEAIVWDKAYDAATRPTNMGAPGAPPTWTPDQRNAGFYALGGYRLPWLGIMPYFGGEYYYLSKVSFVPDSFALWGGLNVRPTDRVVLKLQFTNARFPSKFLDGWKKPPVLNQLIAQAAWSF